ncbi:hypothetical protein U0070_010622 [Myodes glareolus]|uniref:m7GpppN-mRNA hydrolase NUDT17 n=1 Tax=Myodes glareolus TaxID=447135 RepID=A0AAW0H8Z2_MYOGA
MAAARLLLRLAGRLESVNFTQSVCGLLGAGRGPGPWHTHCSLERGQLVLSSHSFPGASERLPIQRPPFCPFVALDQKPGGSRIELPPDRGVDVGVAVILQSSDQTVLLTRRTCTLRISPNVWVPPGEHLGTDAVGDSVLSLHIATGCQSCTVDAQGGHMEVDEEVLECGLRELQEECGLQLPLAQVSCVLLGLWESAYPPRLSWGFPKYHHLILYVLVTSQESEQELQARIQINPNEVSAFMWLGPDVAAVVAATEDGTETPRLLQTLPPSLCALSLSVSFLLCEANTRLPYCNRTEGRWRNPTSGPAHVHSPADNPSHSRGRRAGQRWNQVCSQALAATSGQLKVLHGARTSRGRTGVCELMAPKTSAVKT